MADSSGAAPTAAARAAPGRRRESLRAHTGALVACFLVTAAAVSVYQRQAARSDARAATVADAAYGASAAARELGAAITLARSTVAATASNPAVATILRRPAECRLDFGGVGPLEHGHLDVVGSDGAIACSSLEAAGSPGYAGAGWLEDALRAPAVTGPVVDARTGGQALVVSAPVGGRGAVVAVLDVEGLGAALSRDLGGPHGLEFVVESADRRLVVSRSIAPRRWVGAAVPRAWSGRAGLRSKPDLDGRRRLYGQARVEATGWVVSAGAAEGAALAEATRLSNREMAIVLSGLAVFLAASLLVHRRVARPLRRLSAGVGATALPSLGEPIPAEGPAEVARLAEEVNGLVARAAQEVRTRALLSEIVESSDDAIISKTLDGVITSWNRGAEQMYGYTADEIVGHSVAELVPPGREGELEEILGQLREGRHVDHFETQRVRRDGTVFEASVSVSPLSDDSGRPFGASTVTRDVSERARAEADRRALEHRLRQSERLESLGQLAGGIAHDFNNLLSAISNYAAFVADETADRPAVHDDVLQIQSAADRAARLTRQLLIFGRRERLEPEVLDLNAVVADVHSLLARSIGAQIDLAVVLHPDPCPISADRGQVEQVLLNLAVNARDAMPDGGVLAIETRPAELDGGFVGLHHVAAGPYIELAVSDTGSGMAREVVEHVFEPFFTTKPTGEGTGLGLATVYAVMRDARGSIAVYSEPGIGTTFRLYFPLVDAAVSGLAAGDASTELRGDGERVLVVEDEPAVLELTARILHQSGYRALAAGSLEEAIALATASDFELLLTDSVMPQASGRTLAQRIDAIRPGKPVVFMSGYSPGVAGSRHLVEPGSRFIQKPFNRRTLVEAVHLALHAGSI